MMLSMMGFTINDAFVKSLDSDVPTTQIMAVRGGLMIFNRTGYSAVLNHSRYLAGTATGCRHRWGTFS